MTDLLGQVKGRTSGGGLGGGLPDPASSRRDEGASANGEEAGMAEFFAQVTQIREAMQEIEAGQQRVIGLHESSKTAVQNDRMRDIRERMTRETEDIKKRAKVVKNQLDMLDAANARALKEPGNETNSATERTRTSITNSLKRKLSDIMDEFTALRSNIMQQYRDVVERRFFTVTGDKASDDQIDRLIETGEAENLFQKAILAQGRGRLVDTLNEINERHEAVKELEKSLLELHQMFLDMAVLVETQGVHLDNIEKQVNRAVEHVHKATKQLEGAKTLQKNTRKYMCCALIVFLVILIVVVVFVVKPWEAGPGP